MARLPGPRDPVTTARIGTAILRSPYSALPELRERYGPVSVVGYGPTRAVYMLGREENEFVLSAGATHFTWREAFERVGLTVVDGDTALAVSDGEDRSLSGARSSCTAERSACFSSGARSST